MVMSQHIHVKLSSKHAPTSTQKKQEPPIGGASPDDPIGVTSDETGKSGAQTSPPVK
jgi:hypothetical protein